MKKSHAMTWGEVKPVVGGNNNWMDYLDVFRFTEEWTKIRIIGDLWELRQHWLPTLKKDGKSITSFPRLCLKTGDPDANCPYCNAGLRTNTIYLTNAIIRDIQESKPESRKKLGVIPEGKQYREKGDTFWSPVMVVQFSATTVQKIQGYRGLNRDPETGECYDLNNPKYGQDLMIKRESNNSFGSYDVQRDNQTPLTKEERAYLMYDIDKVYDCIETNTEAIETIQGVYNKDNFKLDEKINIDRVEKVLGISKRGDDDEDDEDYSSNRRKRNNNDDDDYTEYRKRRSDINEYEDKPRKRRSDIDDDDLDDEEPQTQRKRRSRDEDYEDESQRKRKARSNDDDDLDEDTPPRRKKNLASEDLDDLDDLDEKPRKSKKKSDDDDLDEDDEPKSKSKDEDYDDLDEDQPVKKSKSNNDDDDDLDDLDEKPKKRNSKSDSDDDDLDEDDDVPVKKRSARDELDEDFEDMPKASKKRLKNDDDDDEEDEKPKRARRKN